MSPVRLEIAEALRTLGPCSAGDIAAFLDRPSDALYRHIALLEDAGLIREAGYRRGARNAERLIDLIADDFRPRFSPDEQGENDALVHTAETVMKCTQRIIREAGEQNAYRIGEQDRNIAINWEFSWLTRESFEEARALLLRLKELMDKGKHSQDGRPFIMLNIISEVAHKPRAQTKAKNARSTSRQHQAAKSQATKGTNS